MLQIFQILWHITPTPVWEENKFPNAFFAGPPTDFLGIVSSVLQLG